ncbi:MAG TPA: flagellar export chaperone FliS [Tepidisphaeraceae bacterium]|jgi:flagellar protein FliS
MNPQAAQSYLKTRVLTATPEQLQMMLYDGAIRFCEQARPAIERKDWETTYTSLSGAQRIVNELITSLRRDLQPELCEQLAALYTYIYRKLVEACAQHKLDSLDEALRQLRFQRETWAMLMEQLGKQKAATAARAVPFSAPSARMEASISIQG